MDQLKEIWRSIRRVHFWLICATVIMLSTVMWFFAAKQIDKDKKANAQKYTGLFSNVTRELSKDRIPNTTVAQEMQTLINDRIEEIGEAWAIKFDKQNSEEAGILTWPKEIDPQFVEHMEPLRPIEKEVPFPSPDDNRKLRVLWRESYREYIYKELPRLAASIGAEWPMGETGVTPGRGSDGYDQPARGGSDPLAGSGESLAMQSVVHWNPQNQAELLAKHFTWGGDASGLNNRGGGPAGFGSEPTPPNVLEVLYAQEDVWVLRALMKIIKQTNGDAKTRFNAAIKTIHSIHIGKDAVESTGRILLPPKLPGEEDEAAVAASEVDSYSSGGEGDYGDGRGGDMGGMNSDGQQYLNPDMPAGGDTAAGDGMRGDYSDGGRDGGIGTIQAADPAEGRYVDRFYKPLSAEKLRSVLASTETMEPEDAYLAVAKRIPVRMRLSIDQRKLTELLVACANAELTVEVRQLRLNPQDVAPVGDGFGRGSYGDSGAPVTRPGIGAAAETPASNPFPFDVVVEIYGIIYIYNPVDERALGIEAEPGDVSQYRPTHRPSLPNRPYPPAPAHEADLTSITRFEPTGREPFARRSARRRARSLRS